MKLDKETLVKHRFWILLGVEVPLVLIATLVLLFGVRKAIAELEKKVDADVKKPLSIKEIRNQKWLDDLTKQEQDIVGKLDKIWADGWKEQDDLATWPTSPNKTQNLQARFSQGNFVVKIRVSRDKAPPAPNAKKELDYLIRGTVQSVNPKDQELVVAYKPEEKGAAEQVKTFYPSPKMTLDQGGKVRDIESFDDLQEKDHVEITYVHGKYFGDDFTDREKTVFTNTYDRQLPELRTFLANDKDKLVVLVKGGWPTAKDKKVPDLIKHVDKWSRDPLPSAEEIWFAQEDFWVQRELLRAVRTANGYVARLRPLFQDEPAKGKAKSVEMARKEKTDLEFKNPTWLLVLNRTKGHVTGKLRNISRVRQGLDLTFRLQVTRPARGRAKVVELPVGGEPINAGQVVAVDKDFGDEAVDGIFAVEQVLTNDTAPVKRLDKIALGQHSHRTFGPLKARFGTEVKKPAAPGNAGQGQGFGNPMGNKKEEEAADPAEEARMRYSDSTKQFRKMPVALVLVVDQDSVHYVLTALEESKLRFQVTQVTLTRFPGSIKEDADVAKPKDGQPAKPMGEGVKNPMGGGKFLGSRSSRGSRSVSAPRFQGGGSMMGQRGRGRMGSSLRPRGSSAGMVVKPMKGMEQPPQLQEAGGPGVSASGEQGPLLELVVYGYATLYERFPPKPAAARPQKPGVN